MEGLKAHPLPIEKMPWVARRSTAFLSAQRRETPWIECDSRRFFMGFCPSKENTMEHSVLSQTMQALRATDQRLLQLLTLRRQLAMQLAQTSGASAMPTTLEERVSAVVSRLAPQNSGPLDEARLTCLFAAVIMLTEPLFTSLSGTNGGLKKG